jgi:hypothetical protein
MTREELLSQLYDETLVGNRPAVLDLTNEGLASGLGPEELRCEALIPSLEEVGARFERGDFLSTRLFPEVLAAGLGLDGIVHPRARAVVFPSFGAYVGGDITAGLLAIGLDRDARVRLFVDIGTNCQIVLGNREWLLATAAPAGPAFEEAAIRCGMRAADGAIEVAAMTPGELNLTVIGESEPLGLCRSGLVDAVTGLVTLGLLDSSGRFVTEEQAAVLAPGLAARLTRISQERVFVPHWRGAAEDSIYLSQRDVRQLQFAGAAIAAGWRILLEEAGLTEADVKQVLLAGSFGSYLSPAAAIRIGLVPRVAVQLVVLAGEGAKMALLSLRDRAGGLALLEEMRYAELSDRPGFNDQFVERLSSPQASGPGPGRPLDVIACGALAAPVREIAARRGWPVAARALPALLHSRPREIPDLAEQHVVSAQRAGREAALAYAYCGTYGALDELCARYGLVRLPGLHCYDVLAGRAQLEAMFRAEPGTYVLTDFLLRSFDRTVLAELGLDRYPELRDDCFGHYRRLEAALAALAAA